MARLKPEPGVCAELAFAEECRPSVIYFLGRYAYPPILQQVDINPILCLSLAPLQVPTHLTAGPEKRTTVTSTRQDGRHREGQL